MTMLKGVSLSMFLAGCLALYLAVLILINPTVPGVASILDAHMAYAFTVMALAVICCVVAGITWSRASNVSAGTAITAALALSVVFLVVVCVEMGLTAKLRL